MRHPVFRSSGDPVLDRRYALARGYRRDGDLVTAADLLAQTTACAPQWAAAWFTLGEVREALGEREAAAAAFRRARDLDPAGELGAGLRLARLVDGPSADGPSADAMAAGYVAALFDQYAAGFDAALVGRLGYRGPQLVLAALAGVRGTDFVAERCLDLGCGTGLAGAVLRPHCRRLVGVDLSAGMLAEARRRGCYDALIHADLLAALHAEAAGGADLIVAADALVYVGDLGPVFGQVARVLAPGGLFAATFERGEDGIELHASLRYRHGLGYLHATAAGAGLAVRWLDHSSARNDAGSPVPGMVAVLAATPRDA